MRFKEFALNFKYAFRPHKPGLIVRLIKTVIRSQVFKNPPLRYVDFAVDFDCNMKCKHCFATVLRNDNRRRMTPDDYSRVAEECVKLGTVNFSFQGGEPLLLKNLPDIITACKPEKNVISVTTNGTLLTYDNISKMKKIGVDIFTNSSIPEEHDNFRGMKGAFDKTLQGMKIAIKKGINITLGAVVTHQNLKSEGINGLIRMAKQYHIILNIILPVSAGRWLNNREVSLTSEDLKYIEELTLSSPYIRTDFQANLGKYGCGAGKEILYITPYGDVLVCPFIHISFGNIFEDPISVIRSRVLQNPYFSVYHQKCLASTDVEFIEKYLNKTLKADKLPLDYKNVFGQ